MQIYYGCLHFQLRYYSDSAVFFQRSALFELLPTCESTLQQDCKISLDLLLLSFIPAGIQLYNLTQTKKRGKFNLNGGLSACLSLNPPAVAIQICPK